jgi:hypothetical protein
MQTYTLPPLFYNDHRSRELPEQGVSREIGKKGHSLLVEMDAAAFMDIYSDAQFYSDKGVAAEMGQPGLAASARATLYALRLQNPELTVTAEAELAALRSSRLTR